MLLSLENHVTCIVHKQSSHRLEANDNHVLICCNLLGICVKPRSNNFNWPRVTTCNRVWFLMKQSFKNKFVLLKLHFSPLLWMPSLRERRGQLLYHWPVLCAPTSVLLPATPCTVIHHFYYWFREPLKTVFNLNTDEKTCLQTSFVILNVLFSRIKQNNNKESNINEVILTASNRDGSQTAPVLSPNCKEIEEILKLYFQPSIQNDRDDSGNGWSKNVFLFVHQFFIVTSSNPRRLWPRLWLHTAVIYNMDTQVPKTRESNVYICYYVRLLCGMVQTSVNLQQCL